MPRPFPFIIPSRPSPRNRPPTSGLWVHEVKFDGYRVQLHKRYEEMVIYSRNGHDYTSRFPSIAQALVGVPAKSVTIDAEVVACNAKGMPDFRALHLRNANPDQVCCWAFDLLELNGDDTRPWPLLARKAKLKALITKYNNDFLLFSESFEDPMSLLAECEKRGLEGIVSKRKGTPYRSGKGDWVKVKCPGWKQANVHRPELFKKR